MSNENEYQEGINEIKDHRGDHQLVIVSKGHITYRSTEGYKNKQDMIDSAVNSAMKLVVEYVNEIPDEKYYEFLTNVVSNLKVEESDETFTFPDDMEQFEKDNDVPK